MSSLNLSKGWEFVLRGVKVLNDKLDSTGFPPDDGVVAIIVPLNGANKVSNLAEGPL